MKILLNMIDLKGMRTANLLCSCLLMTFWPRPQAVDEIPECLGHDGGI
jgi:hypothetical protein